MLLSAGHHEPLQFSHEPAYASDLVNGIFTVKTLPSPWILSTLIEPRNSCTAPFVIASPSPVPPISLECVRGQAEAGFPAVREVVLPALYTALGMGMDINEAGCAALLELIVHTADTNMIHRGGFDGMQQATLEVREILDRENFPSRETLESLDKRFIEKNLSPGGSADLLALTLLLFFLKEHPQR